MVQELDSDKTSLLPSLSVIVISDFASVRIVSRTRIGINSTNATSLPPRSSVAAPETLVTSPIVSCENDAAQGKVSVKMKTAIAMSRIGARMWHSAQAAIRPAQWYTEEHS